jgi:hypothetical protein
MLLGDVPIPPRGPRLSLLHPLTNSLDDRSPLVEGEGRAALRPRLESLGRWDLGDVAPRHGVIEHRQHNSPRWDLRILVS